MKKILIEFEWDDDFLGAEWFNINNLKSMLYWKAFTREDSLKCKLASFDELKLSKYNPTHEIVGDNCGGIFNKIDSNGQIICSKCGETLMEYFDELALIQ